MLPIKDNIPTRRFPLLTVTLIVANILMFFFFQKARLTLGGAEISEANVVQYGAIPYEITHPGSGCELVGEEVACEGQEGVEGRAEPQPPTLLTAFTSMFMHGGLIHIAGNMLFLWIFGNNIEDSMGRLKFILFYLLGGLVALAAQTAIDPESTAPTIGASGAVAAVLGGYALLYPRARVVTIVFIIFFVTAIELPALLVLGVWFLLQIYDASLEPVAGGGGVAYFAHIGGFLFGLLLIKLFAHRAREDYDAATRMPVY
ncbi:MAG: rhomboid family intramembrane serine protease [Actinomycetota bacterium]|nr:rhomboid family intramembrane serine protease [Actinomycetota bacterium]